MVVDQDDAGCAGPDQRTKDVCWCCCRTVTSSARYLELTHEAVLAIHCHREKHVVREGAEPSFVDAHDVLDRRKFAADERRKAAGGQALERENRPFLPDRQAQVVELRDTEVAPPARGRAEPSTGLLSDHRSQPGELWIAVHWASVCAMSRPPAIDSSSMRRAGSA